MGLLPGHWPCFFPRLIAAQELFLYGILLLDLMKECLLVFSFLYDGHLLIV